MIQFPKKKLNIGSFSWKINEQIHAREVRVIDAEGKQIGVMTLEDALKKSKEEGVDLIEIAPKANPPVCRIIELGKFKYEEEKKLKKQKKGTKTSDIKEIRFSPFIGDADYATRLERVKEFLTQGFKLRAVVKFKGRQMGSKQFGYNLLNKLLKDVGENINVDMPPKFIGRHLTTVISPVTGARKKD